MVLAWDPLPVACQGRGVCELTCLLARWTETSKSGDCAPRVPPVQPPCDLPSTSRCWRVIDGDDDIRLTTIPRRSSWADHRKQNNRVKLLRASYYNIIAFFPFQKTLRPKQKYATTKTTNRVASACWCSSFCIRRSFVSNHATSHYVSRSNGGCILVVRWDFQHGSFLYSNSCFDAGGDGGMGTTDRTAIRPLFEFSFICNGMCSWYSWIWIWIDGKEKRK